MAPVLKITLIQFQPKPLSPEENFARAASEIRAASAQGSHLAVLPEYHLTSWVPESPHFGTCCAQSAPYLARYQSLARELDIHIVPGTIIEAAPAPSDANAARDILHPTQSSAPFELRNMAYFIAATSGSILASYQKKNLWHPERGILTPGLHTPHTSFTIPFPKSSATGTTASPPTIRVGLLICWDLAFPEAFRELTASCDAQLVIVPAFWHVNKISPRVLALNPQSEVTFLDSVVVARAYENTCAVAFCNAFGQSQVAVPILGCLGKMGAEEAGVVSCEVDFEVVDIAEENYKVKKDVRGVGWHYSRSATVLATNCKAV